MKKTFNIQNLTPFEEALITAAIPVSVTLAGMDITEPDLTPEAIAKKALDIAEAVSDELKLRFNSPPNERSRSTAMQFEPPLTIIKQAENPCGEANPVDGFRCSLESGHAGNHEAYVAHDLQGARISQWPRKPEQAPQ
jgi:hypothetical protein